MHPRIVLTALVASAAICPPALAQHNHNYPAPRTESGHPDFQGMWVTGFMTTLERPQGVENLVATPEQARALVAMIKTKMPVVNDPDVELTDLTQLAMVKGEYRTSMIVEPKDGRLPFTQAGSELAARVGVRNSREFDDPEQRPLSERCMESLGYAPIRTVPVILPLQIVQARDNVVIYSEGPVGLRVVHVAGQPPGDWLRTDEGYSVGRWDGDTLIVQTTNFRAKDPARTVIGRPLLLSSQTTITERFTRLSATELFYQFTVEDPELYTQPWTGEFSLTQHDGPIFEYACHEANYSLPNGLSGGQAEAARAAAEKTDGIRK
jgi:hypothetical protein